MTPPDSLHLELPRCLVVGVDPSGSSDHAVQLGIELGARLSAEVDLVHAVPVPDYRRLGFDPARADEMIEILTKRARASVAQHTRSLFPPGSSPAPSADRSPTHAAIVSALASADTVRIVAGEPAQVLLDAARPKHSWIVLGGHRRRRLLDFGNTARAVLAKAFSGVWVQKRPPQPIARILVPVDLSEDSLRALSCACALAADLGASVRAVHCFDAVRYAASFMDYGGYAAIQEVSGVQRAEFERETKGFDWRGVEHSAEFVEGEPVGQILELSRTADLIVLGKHGRTGFSTAVLGGVAYAVIRRSDRPVLVIPNPARRFAS